MRYHIHITSVRVLNLCNSNNANQKIIKDLLGYKDIRLLRRDIARIISLGQEVVHSEGCNNYDKITARCLGHESDFYA